MWVLLWDECRGTSMYGTLGTAIARWHLPCICKSVSWARPSFLWPGLAVGHLLSDLASCSWVPSWLLNWWVVLVTFDFLHFIYLEFSSRVWRRFYSTFPHILLARLCSDEMQSKLGYLMSSTGNRTADSNIHCSVCNMGFCQYPRHWVGMGRSHLALQPCILYTPWHHQVCNSVYSKWEGMG
jgi:hypothetical protein